MNAGTAQWLRERERGSLRRVRLAGLATILILCLVAGWLGWREWKLSGLDARTGAAVARSQAAGTLLDLKRFAMVAHLAKVKANSLLLDITGQPDLESGCASLPDMRGLPQDSSCAATWDAALATVWSAALGPDAPSILPEMKRDPWGSPYLLNQSEWACGRFGEWCPPDSIRSAGPDGKANTPDDIQAAIPQHLGPSRIVKGR